MPRLPPKASAIFLRALSLASGIRHQGAFWTDLSTLAIRALLVNTTEACEYACGDVGRGRVARSVSEIVLCDDDTIRAATITWEPDATIFCGSANATGMYAGGSGTTSFILET